MQRGPPPWWEWGAGINKRREGAALGRDLMNPKAFLSGLVSKVSLALCQRFQRFLRGNKEAVC